MSELKTWGRKCWGVKEIEAWERRDKIKAAWLWFCHVAWWLILVGFGYICAGIIEGVGK